MLAHIINSHSFPSQTVRHAMRSRLHHALRLILVLFFLAGCTQGANLTQTNVPENTAVPDEPRTEIVFNAQVPEVLAEGQSLYIEVLDEVTGLALNASRQKMEPVDSLHYTLTLTLPLSSVMKYRYVRDNDPLGSIEYTSRGQQVRYRLAYIAAPGEIVDLIGAWRSVPFEATAGRIQGQVAIVGSHSPVVNALVSAGGMHTFTASDGSFLLEGLLPGMHNLVVYSLDGAFEVFQQGALVAPDSTTPAFIEMTPAPQVNVTFIVTPPSDHLKGMPIRLIGNIDSLGNTFADLRGGVSVIASRAPIMASLPDGTYSLTLKMPAGLDLRYKYTLGDGFWNAELQNNGAFRLRQLIIPNKDVTIKDGIDTWQRDGAEPVSFTVDVPANTPASDAISIQFKPFGWTEPIPMWPLGNQRWFYALYNPLNLLGDASYRYCRNEQCGTADDAATAGVNAAGRPFKTVLETHNAEDQVTAWNWMAQPADPVVVSAAEVKPRNAGFMAAVEFSPGYGPGWQPYLSWALKNIKDMGANTVILTPSWHITQITPPVIEIAPGQDALWHDVTQMIDQAGQQKLSVVLHPIIRYTQSSDEWQAWGKTAALTDGWWQSWFDRYRTFLLYHADMAAQMDAKALIINYDPITMALLQGGLLGDGPHVPGDADQRWKGLIKDVRGRYSGQLIWMTSLQEGETPLVPDFVDQMDQLYVLVSLPLGNGKERGMADMEDSFINYLDTQLLPLQEKTHQPVVFGLQAASGQGGANRCIRVGDLCLGAEDIDSSVEIENGAEYLDFNMQAELYSAALSAVNQRSWISGFVSGGYYPPVALRDLSYSVRLKPAADVLWYWYPRLLGTGAP